MSDRIWLDRRRKDRRREAKQRLGRLGTLCTRQHVERRQEPVEVASPRPERREARLAHLVELRWALSTLRHAYEQLIHGRVRQQAGREFADGLIAPVIQQLERLDAALSGRSPEEKPREVRPDGARWPDE